MNDDEYLTEHWLFKTKSLGEKQMNKDLEIYYLYNKLKNRKELEPSAYEIACEMEENGLIGNIKQVGATLEKWNQKGYWNYGVNIYFGWIEHGREYELLSYLRNRPNSNNLTKVYVVTAGSYSDYHIKAVFLDKESAYTYKCLHEKDDDNYGDIYVEEYTANNSVFNKKAPVYKIEITFFINLNYQIIKISERQSKEDVAVLRGCEKVIVPNLEEIIEKLRIYGNVYCEITVSSLDSFDKARKIAHEQLQILLQNLFEITGGVEQCK